MTLPAAFARLPPPDDVWEGRHRLGPHADAATTLATVVADGPTLAALLARKQAQARGGDKRLACAFLIGDLGWEIGRVLGGLWLLGWKVRMIEPEAVAIVLREVSWEDSGESGTSVVLDMTLDPAGMTDGGTDPADLAHCIASLLSPLVAELARSTRLGATAQWRLVSDGLAGGLIQQGRAIGLMREAVALGRSITADSATPLRSRRLELIEITCPGQPDVTEWFRLRGGCCRYYTAGGESGDYCTTCVHRDRSDQVARLSEYLTSLHPKA